MKNGTSKAEVKAAFEKYWQKHRRYAVSLPTDATRDIGSKLEGIKEDEGRSDRA